MEMPPHNQALCLLFFFFYQFGCVGLFADVQKEEKNVQKAIRDSAKRNDMASAKVSGILFGDSLIIGVKERRSHDGFFSKQLC